VSHDNFIKSFLDGGAHTVVAAYSGDYQLFYGSTSAASERSTWVVRRMRPIHDYMAASPTTVAPHGALTLTATAAVLDGRSTVAGTVTFTTGGRTVGTALGDRWAAGHGDGHVTVAQRRRRSLLRRVSDTN